MLERVTMYNLDKAESKLTNPFLDSVVFETNKT